MPALTPFCRWLTSAVELKDLSSQEGIYTAAERSLVSLKSEIYPPHPLSLSALSEKEVGQHLTFSGIWPSSSIHPLAISILANQYDVFPPRKFTPATMSLAKAANLLHRQVLVKKPCTLSPWRAECTEVNAREASAHAEKLLEGFETPGSRREMAFHGPWYIQ